MSKFERGNSRIDSFKSKAEKGFKRIRAMVSAIALTVVTIRSGIDAYNDLQAGDKDVLTGLLLFSVVFIALIGAWLWYRFFFDEN